MTVDKITTQEIQFLQIQGFFKPFGVYQSPVFYYALTEDQRKIVDSLVEKRLLEVEMNTVRPRLGYERNPGFNYCYHCPSKSKSRLMMAVHARNSDHMTTYAPKPALQYREMVTP